MQFTRAQEVVGGIVLVGAVAVAGYFALHRSPTPPEQAILGTWQLVDTGGQPVLSSDIPEYVGFVAGEDRLLRTYEGTDAPEGLVDLQRWEMRTSATTTTLSVYLLNDETGDPYKTYEVTKLTARELVLTPSYHDGTSDRTIYVRVRSVHEEADLSFVRTTTQTTETCNTLLGGVYSEEYILLPLTCEESVGGTENPITLYFPRTGGLLVTRGPVTLLSRLDAETNRYGPFLMDGAAQLEDITFDGYADLAVLDWTGAYNFGYSYYAYNPQTHAFTKAPFLTDIVNPGVDTDARTITSYNKGRGLGDIYTTKTYHFENGAYVLVREETQDMISPDWEASGGYERVTYERRSGAMVEVKREHLTEEEVLGDSASSIE